MIRLPLQEEPEEMQVGQHKAPAQQIGMPKHN